MFVQVGLIALSRAMLSVASRTKALAEIPDVRMRCSGKVSFSAAFDELRRRRTLALQGVPWCARSPPIIEQSTECITILRTEAQN